MARTRETDDEQILDAARKLFVSNGLSTTAKEVARAIGISEGVIFQRFGTKAGLISAAMAVRHDDFGAVIAQAARHADPARAFEEVALAVFAVLRRQAPVVCAMPRRPAAARHEAGPSDLFLRCRQAVEDYLHWAHEAGRLEVEAAESAAFMLTGALMQAALFESWAGPTPHVSEQAVRRMARTLYRGVGAAR
jgi:AcrR family transcriptional regulator